MKLKVDGSFHIRMGISGVGGVLRNDSRVWEVGFTTRLGSSTIEEAESWVHLYGLRLAWERGT